MAEVSPPMQAVDFDPFADRAAATLPLTEQQREMYAAVQMGDEASCSYNQCFVLRLRGPFSLQSMERALAQVVERHEALRLRIVDEGETQEILELVDTALTLTDLSGLPEAGFRDTLARLLAHETHTVFDLSAAPLWRAQVLRERPDLHRLIFTAHHIICDGWSSAVIFADLASAYAADRFGMIAQLPVPASYREFVETGESPTFVAETQSAEEFWVERYAGGVPSFELPLDRPRPPLKTYAAAREVLSVEQPLYAAVRKMGAQHGCTLFVTLLAAFEALVARLSGSDELVVGIPMASQALQENDRLVAHGVNTIPLRCQVDMEHTFAEHLKLVRKAFLDAQTHQRLTFGSLLQRLKIARDPSRTPLVNVLFNIDKVGAPFDFGELVVEGIDTPKAYANFELSINAVDTGAGLLIECDYNSDLLEPETVQRWLALYRTALERAVVDPSLPLASMLAPTPVEAELLAGFNHTEADWPRDTRIEALIARQVAASPDRIALTAGDRQLSYRELDARANAVAAKLQALGAGRHSLVGLSCGRNEHMFVGLLGILKSGAGYVPLDPAFPAERLEFMAADAGVRHVVSDRSVSDSLKLHGAERLIVDELGAQAECPTPLGTADDDVAYVIYTSGSTGRPKGVLVPHRTVANLLESVRKEPGMTAAHSVLSVTTLSFDIAVSEVILPLTVGARIVVADSEQVTDGDRLRALVEDQRVDFIDATPSTWRLLLAAGWKGSQQMTAICTGEPLPPDLGRELLPLVGQLWNGYGPTETTVWSSFHRVDSADGAIPIGHPIANTKIHVVDARMRPLPIGVIGELFIGGSGVTLGYLGRPDLSAEKFLPDPFSAAPGARLYRTGDLGRWRPDGVLECLGRSDHQVKVRGYRIELGEIEARLVTHPDLKQAVVVKREDRPGDTRLVAYVVARSDAQPELPALLAHLRKTLPDYMLPQRIVTLPQLPLLPNGKLDRGALPAPEAQVTEAGHRLAPRNDGERRVAEAMEWVLGQSNLNIDDNFFALGGHSLLAARLATRLGQTSGRPVPVRTIFEAPTIEQLAALIAKRDRPVGKRLEPISPRALQGEAPASLMQQRVWFLEQMEPGRPTYNVPSALRLRGALDVHALGRAFNTMIQRQAVLRTEIIDRDGAPVQRVLPELNISLPPIVDLSTLPSGDRDDALTAALAARAAGLINLEHAPLFELGLFRLSSEEHVLFFMPHHLIWDGASFDLFFEEMAALYGAYSRGLEPRLVVPAVSYGDFSHWQQSWLHSDDFAKQLAHWKAALVDLPEPLALPFDRPRPARMSGAGGNEQLSFSSDLTQSARRFAGEANTTLFMMLLAVYAAMLSRITGQTDFVIGTPVRGRHSAEVEKLMGFFVNALPLRIKVAPAQSFATLLQSVREVVLDAFSHPDVPFEQLVRELHIARDESLSPVYQTFFSFLDERQRVQTWGGLDARELHVASPASHLDLGLWFHEHPEGVTADIQYNTDVFSADTARRLRQWFESMLRAAMATPDLPLSRFELVSDAERHAFEAWNRTRVELPTPRSTSAVIEAQTALAPDRQAVRAGAEHITYGELDARANRLAHLLRSRGIGRGALVGLCLERSIDMIVAQLAIMKSGAAYVPLDPAYPPERLVYMSRDANLSLIVAHSSLLSLLDWPRDKTVLIDLDADLLAAQSAQRPPADAERDARAEDPAYAIYTSGSTGQPKGVVVPHRAVVNFLASMADQPGLDASDRLVAVTTLSFDIAVLELLLPLSVGAEIVLASRDDASNGPALRRLIEASNATVMQATPGTWRLLIDAEWQGSSSFKALVGGESLPADLAQQLLQRSTELWNMYGPTETTVWSTCCKIERGAAGITIGRPIANTQVHVLDAHQQVCPVGVAGEIFIGGEGVALGYLHRPELSAERFIADPFDPLGQARLYRTGDRGRWRSDGQLEHLGRLDSQVKVRGHRIELGEIETNLLTHSQLANAVVIVREDTPGDVRLVAYVVPRSVMPADGELREHLRSGLPQYMLPQHFVAIDTIPLLPNGKINRRALPPPSQTERAPTLERPLTDAEAAIAVLWKELLNIDDIRPTDNFFDLGGHSMLAARAINEMNQRLGLRLTLQRIMFESLGQLSIAPVGVAANDNETRSTSRPGLLSRWLGSLVPTSKGKV